MGDILLAKINTGEMNLKFTLFVATAVFLTAVSGCSELYHFTGVVVDGDGVPVSGASIFLRPHDWEAPSWDYKPSKPATPGTMNTSDADGTFEACWGSNPSVEFFRMTIVKEGYKTSEQIVVANAKDVRIVLERVNTVFTDENAG